MIEKIRLKEIASYNNFGVKLENLKNVNFIFGNNGSGKTTLSEFIRNPVNFPSCSMEWKGNPMTTCVYNRNFVNENFLSNSIKGIFTLGKESVELQTKIDELKGNIIKHDEEIRKKRILLGEKSHDRAVIVDEFKEKCWRLKKSIDPDFKELIEGYRNSKEKFMQKCIEESKLINSTTSIRTLEEIKILKEGLYNGKVELVAMPTLINYDNTFESDPIFKNKIIGKEDVDIARLITKLGISDWVKQGILKIHDTDGICPFCQQLLPDYFTEQINLYFDDTYEQNIETLGNSSENYLLHTEEIISKIKSFCNVHSNNTFVDLEEIISTLRLIESKHEENKLLLKQKIKEPSRSIELVEISELVQLLNISITASVIKIEHHNKRMENIKLEREKLSAEIWLYIADQISEDLKIFDNIIADKDKMIRGIENSISKKIEYKISHEKELAINQQQITSVEHSVNEINKYLNSFGFKNFKLAAAAEEGNYKIIRENGEDVKDTLSEGEKTFITFLYFYQLLKGSNDISKITTNKVVVIDDPISSLDSSVLFMVSSLVREIMFDVNSGKSDIKQLFILTHNIYFHKEITFNKGSKRFGEGTYWIIRKDNNISSVKYFEENPISTSYELLWKELKYSDNISFVSIQNSMRRILENYFKFYGGISLDVLEDKFDHEERMICRSLISWVNDGSHFISEDLYVENNTDLIQKYLVVFKEIFIKNGHSAHYSMMMKENVEPVSPEDKIEDSKQSMKEILSGVQEVASVISE